MLHSPVLCVKPAWAVRYAWLKQCQWISDGENWVSEHWIAQKLSQGNSKRRSLLSAGCGMGICQTCHFLFCSLPAKGLSFAVYSLFFSPPEVRLDRLFWVLWQQEGKLYLTDEPVRDLKSVFFFASRDTCGFFVATQKKSCVCFTRLWRISELSLCKTRNLSVLQGISKRTGLLLWTDNNFRRAGDFRILTQIHLLVRD